MCLAAAVIGILPTKPCYDGATTSAEKTLGSGGRFWLVPHLFSYQHTKTGKKKLITIIVNGYNVLVNLLI